MKVYWMWKKFFGQNNPERQSTDQSSGLTASSADSTADNAVHTEKMKDGRVRTLKKGPAMRVIFFYPGEEGTYIDNAQVTLYENGIVHIRSNLEETTTHLQNCEILWKFETEAEDRANKVRLLKPKSNESPSKGGPPNNP